MSRFNTGHGDNTYNSGAEIGDKQTYSTGGTRNKKVDMRPVIVDVFESYLMQI